MVRTRTTRFTPRPIDSVSRATQVTIPRVTRPTVTTVTQQPQQRATRFTPPRQTPRPTPRPRPTQRPTETITRVSRTTTARQEIAPRVRTTRLTPARTVSKDVATAPKVIRTTVTRVPVQQVSLGEILGSKVQKPDRDLGEFTGFSAERITGKPKTEAEFRARTDPRFFLTTQQQSQAGIGVKPKFSQDRNVNKILGGLDSFASGLESFERGKFETKLQESGIDPRSAVGEVAGGFSEFSVGFSEEVVGQASSLVNLGNLLTSDIKRKGRIDLEILGRSDIGFGVGEPELVATSRELKVPRTITSEFIGGGIEGLITGQDAGALAQQRAGEFLTERKGQEIRTTGQLGGFLLPFAVGGAGIVSATLKAPRAFLPQVTTKVVKATPALRKQQQQIAFKINKIRIKQESLQDKNVQQVLKIQGIKFKNEIPTKSLSLKESKKIQQLDEAFRIKNNKLTEQVRGLNRQIPKSVGADEIAIPIVESQQVARGLTFFGRPIISKISGQGRLGGFRRGAPSADDLLPEIKALGSTPRTAPSFAEGGTSFQQGVNETVVTKLVQRGDLSKEFGEFFIEAGRTIRTANRSPVNVLRGFGKQPISKLTVAENTAVKDFFSTGGGKGLQIKGSFSARTQIRKEGLRKIGDIDADLSKFGAESVELSAVKAKELAGLLSKASGRKFSQGSGNRVGKVDLVKGKKKDKIVEFLNTLDEEEAIAGLNKQDIVFGVKGTSKSTNVEGINVTRLTQEFKRKTASVFSLQRSGTAGVPDDAGQALRFGAPKGRFEKDAVDLFHEGKTIVATLRGLNRTDRLKQSIKLKGVSKKQIDRLEEFVDTIPKRFPKNSAGRKINFNNPSASTKQLISFTRSNPLKSIGSKSIKAGSKSSKALSSSGIFARSLNSALKSKPSKTSRASGFSVPSIASFPSGSRPSGSKPSGSRPSGSGSFKNIFDPFPSSPSPTGSKPSGSKPSGSTPTGSGGGSGFGSGSGISGISPSGVFLGSPSQRGQQPFRRRGRSSRLGRRLFDIADEPFGKVAVGLGFFVEARRGETTIEEALGIGNDDEFEPITRQEKQARERLGRNGGSQESGFGLDDFFS